MHQAEAIADIVIFGGGIAGLWLLDRLRAQGYSVVLLETHALGSGQTIRSQGIIHGGMKYALEGNVTEESLVLRDMPNFWRRCLKGEGAIDLSHVPILSQHHYLWAPQKLMAKVAGFIASSTLHSAVKVLNRQDYPSIFQHSAFKGEVFALDEIVIDVPILLRELIKINQDALYRIDPLNSNALSYHDDGSIAAVQVSHANSHITIRAQQFIFTAGAGNEQILRQLNQQEIVMQRRPLHMVLAKLPVDMPLYAHCFGIGPRPRITITTHYNEGGEPIWYLGGQLAEEGVNRPEALQHQAAAQELRDLFPWVDFSKTIFHSFLIDRAEPLQKSGFKPERAYFQPKKNYIFAWPTKLALAPQLAEDVTQYCLQNLRAELHDLRPLRAWPMPPLAAPIWEENFCKNVA